MFTIKLLQNSKRSYSSQIKKVLIANRGEIACRVSRTAKRLGIKTVAVFSDADVNALHVASADEAYYIGAAPSSESYLRADKLLMVAKETKCQAVHPGYGFLSENADFAEKCETNGIIFIGPPPSAIRDMGCKSTSKKIMEAAGVPIVKGYHGEDQSNSKLKAEAEKIGYPVMLKALKGGGGKGMRVVLSHQHFDEQLASARNEAMKAFGDTAMLVESFVSHPRHVEVQIFGDRHGNYIHLHERDCSVQRRHQKVIEEAPAPGLPTKVRSALGDAAVRAAQAVGYVGAGTVEFILDASTLNYYFMEMNTRLQVEHPVTEMITRLDLVELQFKVAAGERLLLSQKDIPVEGHSFETRIYAEDPDNGFLPQAGTLQYLNLPVEAIDIRVDTGVRQGDEVSVFYDPLIAKLIVWGKDRSDALKKLDKSLSEFQVSGLPCNVNFLLSLARHPEFASGNVHTSFITKHKESLLKKHTLDEEVVASAVAAQLYCEFKKCDPQDPFSIHSSFRVNLSPSRVFNFKWLGEPLSVRIQELGGGAVKVTYTIWKTEKQFILSSKCKETESGGIIVETNINDFVKRSTVFVSSDCIQIFNNDGLRRLEIPQEIFTLGLSEEEETSGSQASSPMPGVVDQIMVATNDVVSKGQALVTVIAMKMEYTIRAPKDGIISELLCKPGDSVPKGAMLVRFQEAE